MAGFPKSYLTDGFDNKKFKVDKNNQLMILDKNQVQNYVSSNDCLYDSDGFIQQEILLKFWEIEFLKEGIWLYKCRRK